MNSQVLHGYGNPGFSLNPGLPNGHFMSSSTRYLILGKYCIIIINETTACKIGLQCSHEILRCSKYSNRFTLSATVANVLGDD